MALRAFPRPSCENCLFNRGIYMGFDGSVVRDDSWVYVLGALLDYEPPVQQIDYFHGFTACGIPVAQMMDDSDITAVGMISISTGFTVQRITAVQRRWRLRRSRLKMQQMISCHPKKAPPPLPPGHAKKAPPPLAPRTTRFTSGRYAPCHHIFFAPADMKQKQTMSRDNRRCSSCSRSRLPSEFAVTRRRPGINSGGIFLACCGKNKRNLSCPPALGSALNDRVYPVPASQLGEILKITVVMLGGLWV